MLKVIEKILLGIIVFFFAGLCLQLSIYIRVNQQYTFLAQAFLKGQTYFLDIPGTIADTVIYQDSLFWPLGPIPALLLTVPVWVAEKVDLLILQTPVQFLMVMVVFGLGYALARKFGSSKIDSLWWTTAFVCGSTFSGVALLGMSWQFAQVVTVFLVFASIGEYVGRKNYFVIGTLMGMVWLTRMTAGIGIVFFLWEAWVSSKRRENILRLAIPFGVFVMAGLGYNFIRFGNIWEVGYSWQVLDPILNKARNYGLFNIQHLSGNLYRFLIAGPTPIFNDGETSVLKPPFLKADPWGMAIWVTAPYVLKIFTCHTWNNPVKKMMLTSILIAMPIFMYYGVGIWQLGYRYALDFLPWIHISLLYLNGRQKMSFGYKTLISVTAMLNIYWLISLYFIKW